MRVYESTSHSQHMTRSNVNDSCTPSRLIVAADVDGVTLPLRFAGETAWCPESLFLPHSLSCDISFLILMALPLTVAGPIRVRLPVVATETPPSGGRL